MSNYISDEWRQWLSDTRRLNGAGYRDFGEYRTEYMREYDIRHGADMYRSVEETIQTLYEKDLKVDNRFPRFGESDLDPHVALDKLQFVTRYEAMMFAKLPSRDKAKGLKKVTRRNSIHVVPFLGCRGAKYIEVPIRQMVYFFCWL